MRRPSQGATGRGDLLGCPSPMPLVGGRPSWVPRAKSLWWVDIYARAIHRYEPRTGRTQTFATAGRPGCLAVRERGGLVLAMGNGFHFFDPSKRQFECIVEPESNPDTRMN